MADYGADKWDYEHGGRIAASAEKTSILQTKMTKTIEVDFGRGPYTMEHLREFVRETEDLPPGAKIRVHSGDSQRDGQWLKITVAQ